MVIELDSHEEVVEKNNILVKKTKLKLKLTCFEEVKIFRVSY
jgi:hypothetical protein